MFYIFDIIIITPPQIADTRDTSDKGISLLRARQDKLAQTAMQYQTVLQEAMDAK